MKASVLIQRLMSGAMSPSNMIFASMMFLCLLTGSTVWAESGSEYLTGGFNWMLAAGSMNGMDMGILAIVIILVGLIFFYAGNDKTHWRPYFIVLFLFLSVLSIYYPGRYGPDMRLRKASDLEGGTTLIYEVAINEEKKKSRTEILEQTIQVLRERIDPNNLMNLVFRPQPPNRIEIEMSLAPPRVKKLRDAYNEAREDLLAQNLSQRVVDSVVRIASKDERLTRLKSLSGGSQSLEEKLIKLAEKYDAKEVARKPYDSKQSDLFKQQDLLEQLKSKLGNQTAEDEGYKKASLKYKTLEVELIPLARASHEADVAYETIQDEVLTINISTSKLDKALKLSDVKPESDDKTAASPRENEMNGLIAAYPSRAEAIKDVFAKFDDYEKVRGPLDDYNDLVALISRSGVLEFRIVPEQDLFSRAEEFRATLQQRGPKAFIDGYKWIELDDSFYDSVNERETIEADPQAQLSLRGFIGDRYGEKLYVILADSQNNSLTTRQENWEVTDAYPTQDNSGFPAVSFTLNARGGYLMGQLTGNHQQQRMAIVLDNKMRSAPVINSQITTSGIITGGRGGFAVKELNSLIRTLNAGSLQAALRGPVSIQNVDSALGEHNKASGIRAAIGAVILVAVFMLIYYYFVGVVANFALISNIILILGWMAIIQAQFTLPGIAALVLTVGMSVDANVLIFERIREELKEGLNLEAAIQLGYKKALSTILDANITTFITCLVLGSMGTPEVKGFAITLSLGIFASMFTAIFCTRVIIDAWVKWRRPATLAMAPIKFPALAKLLTPNIDWLAKRGQFRVISVILVIVSLGMVVTRGSELLDIEFSSGTQVDMSLKEDAAVDRATFEKRLKDAAKTAKMERLADSQVQSTGLGDAGYPKGFKVTTLEEDSEAVRRILTKTFSDILVNKPSVSFQVLKNGVLKSNAPSVAEATPTEVTTDGPAIAASSSDSDELVMPGLREAPVYVVDNDDLGRVIDRPGITADAQLKDLVRSYRGGVAIVVSEMKPAITIDDLTERIRTMRSKPPHNEVSAPRMDVIGLDTVAANGGESLWSSAVVLVQDESLNLLDDPGAFYKEDGLAKSQWELVFDALSRERSLGSVTNFTASVSSNMRQQAFIAMIASLICVVIYIWFRFGSLRYGMAAIAALVHDISIALGAVAIGGMLGLSLRIDLVMIGAFLTIVGYSLNDTIVIFDRIRENRGEASVATESIVNHSINQTVSRTVLTSGTTFLAVMTLLLFGGDGIFGFAFSMAIGVIIGTYSSIAIAAPLLLGHKATTIDSSDSDQAAVATA